MVALDYTLPEPPEAGVWCPECALPSAIRFLVILTPRVNPLVTVWRGRVTRCLCGWQDGGPAQQRSTHLS